MPRYLLDTSALLAHSRRERGWERVQSLFDDGDAEILVASVSLTEMARRLRELGASVAEARQLVVDYQQVVSAVVPIDAQIAHSAFDIGCETRSRLPLTDALIAAAARDRSARLVHRDRHFRDIPAALIDELDLTGNPGQE